MSTLTERDSIEVTQRQTWQDGDTEITVETSDTERAFGQRMMINGKSERGWAWHNSQHGPHELFGTSSDGVTCAFF